VIAGSSRRRWLLLLALAAQWGACGRSGVSPQLVAARAVTAKVPDASEHERQSGSMRAARRLLARAEAQIDGSEAEQHFAFLAERRALVAISETRRAALERAAAGATPATAMPMGTRRASVGDGLNRPPETRIAAE